MSTRKEVSREESMRAVVENPPVSIFSSPLPLYPYIQITLQSSVLVFAAR